MKPTSFDMVSLMSREKVELHTTEDIMKARIEDIVIGTPRYRAKQMKELNSR